MDSQFKPRNGTPLRQRVLDFVQERGTVTGGALELRFPEYENDFSPLYRALRKLVADGNLVRKRIDNSNNAASIWQTPQYAEIESIHIGELNSELLDRLEKQHQGVLSSLSKVAHDNVGHFVSDTMALVMVASADKRYRNIAQKELADTIAMMKAFLKTAELLQVGLKIGNFAIPPVIAERLPELRDIVHSSSSYSLQIEIPHELQSSSGYDEEDHPLSEQY